MMKHRNESPLLIPILSIALWATACGGTASDGGGDSGDGDGDVTGDGDTGGDGDTTGDGDVVGTGGTPGDGDGDLVGVGGTRGDGDGDIVGVGGALGDGDGDLVGCTDIYMYGLNVVLLGAAYPPPPAENAGDTLPAPIPPGADPIAPPPEVDPNPVPPLPCEGSAVAVDGDYVEQLTCYPGAPRATDCTCYGAGERQGAYSVTATWGYIVETQDVTLFADECHVIPQDLTFFAN